MTNTTTTDCINCTHSESEHSYHGDCDWQDGFLRCTCDAYASPTVPLTQELKDRVLAIIDAGDEYETEDADQVRALPIGTEIPLEFTAEREDRLGWYPEEMTPVELVSNAISAYQIPLS